MHRRDFVKQTALTTIGIGAFGSISWAGNRYVGDSITTTDILGPFYRPNAPLRTDLNPIGFNGEALHLFGTITMHDGKTPVSNCLVEIWQNNSDGYYDNISDEYLGRGSQRTSKEGAYNFITKLPVPEPLDEKLTSFRPAHIHLRISAEGHQDLITQIYFQGDPHLATDPSTRSDLAINRVLTVKKRGDKTSEIQFDIALKKEYLPEDNVYQKISGVYKMTDGTLMEFYRDGDLLFYKTNGQIWGGLAYSGNNTFGSKEDNTEATFELQPKGNVKVRFRFSRRRDIRLEGMKMLVYRTGQE